MAMKPMQLALGFAVLLALPALAVEPETDARLQRVVLMNPSLQLKMPTLPTLQTLIVVSGQIHADKRRLDRHELVKEQLPGLDLGRLLADELRCLPGPAKFDPCQVPTVLEGRDSKVPDGNLDPGNVISLVSITFDYNTQGRFNGFVFFTTFTESRFTGAEKPEVRTFMVRTDVSAPEKMKSPFPVNRTGSPSESELEARRYWFSGQPSRFELALRGALADFKLVATSFYPYAGDENVSPVGTPWARTLPTVMDVQATYHYKCQRALCRLPVVDANEHRLLIPQVVAVPKPWFGNLDLPAPSAK